MKKWKISSVSLAILVCVTMLFSGCATGKSNLHQNSIVIDPIKQGEPSPMEGWVMNQDTLDEIDAALLDLDVCESKEQKWWEKPILGFKWLTVGLLGGYYIKAVSE